MNHAVSHLPVTGNAEGVDYRYFLTRDPNPISFGPESNPEPLYWLCLNPSTATEDRNDPTTQRIQTFSRAQGKSAFVLMNLFPARATAPGDLVEMARSGCDIVGENRVYLEALFQPGKEPRKIVCAWGNDEPLRKLRRVAEDLNESKLFLYMDWIRKKIIAPPPGVELHAYLVTAGGNPWHPLYLNGKMPLNSWAPDKRAI